MKYLQSIKTQMGCFRALARRNLWRFWRLRYAWATSLLSTSLQFYVTGILVGSKVQLTGTNFSYTQTIIPGLLVSFVISSSTQEGTFALFYQRFTNEIKSILASPAAPTTVLLAFLSSSCFRVGAGAAIYLGVMKWCIPNAHIAYPLSFLLLLLNTFILFTILGFREAITCSDFTDAGVISNFIIILGLSLSGNIYSISSIQNSFLRKFIIYCNPFYYIVSAARYYFLGESAFIPFSGFNFLYLAFNILAFLGVKYLFNHSKNIRG